MSPIVESDDVYFEVEKLFLEDVGFKIRMKRTITKSEKMYKKVRQHKDSVNHG
jgi:hypothetical protein